MLKSIHFDVVIGGRGRRNNMSVIHELKGEIFFSCSQYCSVTENDGSRAI